MNRARAGAWIVLLALAGAQAWAARFYITPDGVSYMDLSDAVIDGRWGELLNAYWSPLYPLLIGALRTVLRPSPYWEFGVTHLLNFALFAISLAGFEYFVAPVRELGRTQWNKPGLATTWGTIGAYALFGAFTLMMTPLLLPTPDLLVSAACFFSFGALLRLRYGPDPRRAGLVLGVALAAGSLAKSFMIPWAGVCIATAIAATRSTSIRPALAAAGLWFAVVLPWTVGLTARYGHLTFGDTGRLTYVWYVNRVETPSAKLMPSGAGSASTDSILAGTAITPGAAGTNPVWYDPTRWYTGLTPRFSLDRQLEVFGLFAAEYVGSLSPVFVIIAFWLIAAGRPAVADWWSRSWPVVVPSIAALLAYAMVLVTTRYVAPFYMALLILVIGGVNWPARIPPIRMTLAIGVPLVFMAATPDPVRAMAMINAAVSTVLIAWLLRYRSLAVRLLLSVAGGMVVLLLQPANQLLYVALMTTLIILCYGVLSRAVEERDEWVIASPLIRRSLLAANAVLVLHAAAFKYAGSLRHPSADPGEPNDSWYAVEQAATVGLRPGARIALVGSPFEAYWARTGRVNIVAVVPPPRMERFNRLTASDRRRLYEAFAQAGADFIVVQQEQPPDAGDQSWRPARYIGWVKPLR